MEEKKELTEAETKKKDLKAKDCSLWAKITGAVIIVAGHIIKWLGFLPEASSREICNCSISVMAIFGTEDLNILIDKFTKKD